MVAFCKEDEDVRLNEDQTDRCVPLSSCCVPVLLLRAAEGMPSLIWADERTDPDRCPA